MIEYRDNKVQLEMDREGSPPARLIAIYLPQFHPTSENDAWWGKGFTEWTNVAKARPKFEGHYQPHIPADLGFYDLRLPETRQGQADLAREYGIYGFCYYHYWFNGKRLLSSPLDAVLESGEPDFPFCLCWANENWTRVWDGQNDAVLARQEYSEADDRAHIEWLLQVFRDKRYICVAGKPLIIIYRASELPSPRRTAEIWREAARKSGLGEIFLCWFERSRENLGDPEEMGFDAAVEFQPDWGKLGEPIAEIPETAHRIFDYETFVQRQLKKHDPPYLRFPCVMPSWDNSARRTVGALTMAHADPATYGKWLESAVSRVKDRPEEEKIVFINAWNEWAEGNHLEPDLRFGRAYLEATRDALSGKSTEATALGQVPSSRKAGGTTPEGDKASLPDPLAIYYTRISEISERLRKLALGGNSGMANEREADARNELALSEMAQTLSAAALELEQRIKRFYGQTGWRDEIQERDQRIAVLEKEIRWIESSYSWAITKPLRSIFKMVDKLFR